jgi:DNA (cytosine-5)-methyltransferase 1
MSGLPYVIENVQGAPLLDPVVLCGAMFGLRTYRHRLFEANFLIKAPAHPPHVAPTRKMGRPIRDGEFMHVVGNFSGVGTARDIMGMPWASRDGLREAIPPAYTKHIGLQLMAQIQSQRIAA